MDLLHSYLADEHAWIENLRIVGVTKEGDTRGFDTFMEYTTKAYQSMEIPLELSPLFRSIRARYFLTEATVFEI